MMQDGINIKQRDIILIGFPYSDLSQVKIRPAIILSNTQYNAYNEDIICCAITSNPREYDKSLPIEEIDFEFGKLFYPSRIKPTKILSLDRKNIIRVLARLKVSKIKEVVNKVNSSIKIEE